MAEAAHTRVSEKSANASGSPEAAPDSCTAALEEFARFGFRRTSMVGLADAVGVSRQTLYNRFGNKESVLSWAVDGLVNHVREEAIAYLSTSQRSPNEVLQEVFWQWLGTIAVMLHKHQHAEEILGLSKAELARSQSDPLEGISNELGAYLLRKDLRANSTAASDTAFSLVMAAKGLMHSSGSEAAFRSGMSRIVAGMGIE